VMMQRLSAKRAQTEEALSAVQRLSPRALLDRRRQSLDERRQRMWTGERHRLALLREQLEGSLKRLEALNPRSVLNRGYAVVSFSDTGTVIKRTAQVASGDAIDVKVSDGRFPGTVA